MGKLAAGALASTFLDGRPRQALPDDDDPLYQQLIPILLVIVIFLTNFLNN